MNYLSVEILIEQGLLKSADLLNVIPKQKKIAIIADEAVVETVAKKLPLKGKIFSFPSGEKYKSREQKEKLENALFESGFGRDTLIIAVGGGVASDLVGFVAATFCRGVPWIIVPTTLLAMVDAAIGGKTGVDTPYGKNLIGAIHQPDKIFIDPEVLTTLTDSVYREGLSEVIKHGILLDESLFKYLKDNKEAIFNREPYAVEKIIKDSCRIKGEVVRSDEKETSLRRLLNFGHTVGHALESLSGYELSHGNAVAHGMLIESCYLREMGLMEEEAFEKITDILKTYNFTFKPVKYPFEVLWKEMTHDKKAKDGLPRICGVKKIGEPLEFEGAWCTEINPEKFKNIL